MASRNERREAKKAQRALAREKRAAARDEIMSARLRTAGGFAGAYLLTQVLPTFVPTMTTIQPIVDGVLAVGGGILAVTNDGPIGDFALGAGLVGSTQTLDNVGNKINEALARP